MIWRGGVAGRGKQLAQGESVIWTYNDSNDSMVTVQTLKE
jgi:hypothetical protein